jgi:thiazole/oxazole-forming peptide maturase SagC family component
MKRLAKDLVNGGTSIQELKKEYEMKDADISELQDLFSRLQQDGFIYDRNFLDKAIGGSFLLMGFSDTQASSFRLNDSNSPGNRPKVAVLTTMPKFSEKNLLQLSQYEKWLDITTIDLGSMPDLFQYDSTERTNATELLQFIDRYKNLVNYESILVILAYPNPTLLRNLNRLFIHYRIPWILATLDGPFIMLTSFVPYESACFECLELRITSQIRSMEEYKSYISLLTQKDSSFKDIEFTPVLQIPVSIAMSELILLSSFKANHFVGRLLSIYLPFFEIQMQDVLRLPICPACGHTGKATMDELYFDFRKVLSDITDKLK